MLTPATAMPATSYAFIAVVVVGFPLAGWLLYRHMMDKDWVTEAGDR